MLLSADRLNEGQPRSRRQIRPADDPSVETVAFVVHGRKVPDPLLWWKTVAVLWLRLGRVMDRQGSGELVAATGWAELAVATQGPISSTTADTAVVGTTATRREWAYLWPGNAVSDAQTPV